MICSDQLVSVTQSSMTLIQLNSWYTTSLVKMFIACNNLIVKWLGSMRVSRFVDWKEIYYLNWHRTHNVSPCHQYITDNYTKHRIFTTWLDRSLMTRHSWLRCTRECLSHLQLLPMSAQQPHAAFDTETWQLWRPLPLSPDRNAPFSISFLVFVSMQ